MIQRNCAQCGRLEYPLRRNQCHACYERGRRAGQVPSLVDAALAYGAINRLRAAGWNYREIARAAGIDRSLIAWIVNGRQAINADTSRAILNINPADHLRFQVNRCGWHSAARQSKRRPGVLYAGQIVGCGDCEQYPCRCQDADDWDIPLLGLREGGAVAS